MDSKFARLPLLPNQTAFGLACCSSPGVAGLQPGGGDFT